MGGSQQLSRIKAHETLFVSCKKREYRIHEAVDKIGNIARHYDADVFVGKLNTGKFKSDNKKMQIVKLKTCLSTNSGKDSKSWKEKE